MKNKGHDKLFSDIEQFCNNLRPLEDICYLEHKYNDKLISLAKKFSLLGMPVKRKYKGREADNKMYVRAMERIGVEGTGIRTFFSGHSSLGQKTIQKFGNEQQKKKYLVPSTKGNLILAFALTEPEAGSNPLGLKMRYRKSGRHYILNGVKYLISNAGIADAVIVFARGPDKRISAFIIDSNKKGFLN